MRDQLAANRPVPRRFGAVLTDRETIRPFLGALDIPAVVWLAGAGWQGVSARSDAPGPIQANGTAKAAQNLADESADIAQTTSLVPSLMQPGPQAQPHRILGSVARAVPRAPVSARYYRRLSRPSSPSGTPPPGDKAGGAGQLEVLPVTAHRPMHARQPPGQALPAIGRAVAANAGRVVPNALPLQVYREPTR